MIILDNLVRSVFRPSNNKLHIVTMCQNDEKYIALLSKTQHNFYTLPNQQWNNLIEPQPSNVSTLTSCDQPVDFIICYNRAEQYEQIRAIANQLHIPIILVDMCCRDLIRPQNLIESVAAKNPALLYHKPVFQVCCTDAIAQSWNKDSPSMTIPIGIDTDKYIAAKKDELLICLDNNTHAEVGARISTRLPSKFSTIPTDQENSDDISVNKAKYFINTNKAITVKTLEAMSAEAVVFCLRTEETEKFINHDQDGILFKDIEQLSQILERLDQDDNKRLSIAKAARSRIIENHSLNNFIDKWRLVFNSIESAFYTPDM